MKFIKKILAGLMSGLLALGAGSTLVFADETVKIGGNYEQSGDAASYGSAMVDGLNLAVKQVNENGGVLGGKQLEAVIYDNKSDITETASIAERLVSEGVVGVVGPATTGDSLAQMPILNDAGIPNVMPAATADGITLDSEGNVYEYIYRVCFEDSYQGTAAATFASEKLAAKKAAIFVDSSMDYSRGLADSFTEEFTKRGGEVVFEDSFAAGDNDFTTIVTNALSQDFDVLYIPAYYTESGMIIKQAREMGLTQAIIGPDGFSANELVELAQPQNTNDVYYTDHFSSASEDEVVVDFLKAFEDEYGRQATTFAALGYDAAMLIVDAIERSGSTEPEKINQALSQTKDYKGVTGVFSIDENHNPVKSAVIIELQNGEIASAEPVSVN